MSQWKQAVTAGRASDPDLQWLWKGREGRLDASLVPVFAPRLFLTCDSGDTWTLLPAEVLGKSWNVSLGWGCEG